MLQWYALSCRVLSANLPQIILCCSVLQWAALCCRVLQCVAVCGSVLQSVAERCSVLQRVATCCSVLQRVAVDAFLYRSCFRKSATNNSHTYLQEDTCYDEECRSCVCVCVCVCHKLRKKIWVCVYMCLELSSLFARRYGVAAISRLLKIIGLFCKRAL